MAYVTGNDGRASIGLPAGQVTMRFFLADGTALTMVLHIAAERGREYVVRLPTDRKTP
jgi:hypothetical protein